jgi:hypothetical protein
MMMEEELLLAANNKTRKVRDDMVLQLLAELG